MKERKEKKEGRNGEVAPIGVSSCPALGLRSRRALSSGQERQVYHEKAEAITKVCYDSQYRATWLSLNPDSNSSGGPHYGEHCKAATNPAMVLLSIRILEKLISAASSIVTPLPHPEAQLMYSLPGSIVDAMIELVI